MKNWFGKDRSDKSSARSQSSDVRWLQPTDNPWGVPVLDVSPVTLSVTSASADFSCAANAVSFRGDDGTSFIGVEPPEARTILVGLQFPIDRMLADGALFIPKEMEHKWAIYFHRQRMLFIRSWQRQVLAVAEVESHENHVLVTRLRGAFVEAHEEPSFTVGVLDYLLRSHALNTAYPAPLWPGLEANPRDAAIWCFSQFGNRIRFATSHAFPRTLPQLPLRTHSLLHIAVARGDSGAARSVLDSGVPADLLAGDGLAPLHWALVRRDTGMVDLLLERGSSIDVRSVQGATPLMNAVQEQSISIEMVSFLLDRGADPNATDNRGFTALHRAAEFGQLGIVQLLLDRGANRHPESEGYTPQSLAQIRGHDAVVRLLSGR